MLSGNVRSPTRCRPRAAGAGALPRDLSFRTTPSPRLRASPVHGSRTASQAGAEDTKQLLAQYGDRLICVRYRDDAQRKKPLKTVEFVVAAPDWEPLRSLNGRRSPKTRSFASRVALADVATRDMV